MIQDIRGLGPVQPQRDGGLDKKIEGNGPSFKDLLDQKTQPAAEKLPELKFSSHAVDRMSSRGIRMDAAGLKRLTEGLERARQKGSKDTLLLMDDNAFIVNVKNSTVVTAMDRNMMKENVFTNIDSTIVL
jgi:flagellar operon protein